MMAQLDTTCRGIKNVSNVITTGVKHEADVGISVPLPISVSISLSIYI